MGRFDGSIQRSAQGDRECTSGIDWIKNSVVPDFGGCIVGAGSFPILVEKGTSNSCQLLLCEPPTVTGQLSGLNVGQHTCRLLGAHRRDLRLRPGEDEPRIESTSRHSVGTCSVRAVANDRKFWDRRSRDGHDQLGTILGYATALVFAADHETRRILQEEQGRPVLVA